MTKPKSINSPNLSLTCFRFSGDHPYAVQSASTNFFFSYANAGVGAIQAGFKNYVKFRGTATRPEYWYWVLFTFLVWIVSNALDRSGTISGLFSLATLLPGLGVTVRRLRDANFSWTWLLLPVPGYIPFVYGLVIMFVELFEAGFAELALTYTDEQLGEVFVMEVMSNPQLQESLVIVLVSLLYIGLTSILVNVIFAAQRSKSFEQGNKRVAPKGPESPIV